jgi:hypothetical protein
MWGTYVEGTLTARTDIAWKRPNTRRVNVHARGNEVAEGFDGRTWEYDVEGHHLVVDPEGDAAAAAGRRGAEFDESFVDYRGKGHTVAVLGSERFADRRVTRIRVTLADGWVKEYLFDEATGLIAALRKAMPIHARGPAVESLTSYADWRLVAGLLVPHRFVERETATGRLMNTLQWDSIRTNVPLGPAELGRPDVP